MRFESFIAKRYLSTSRNSFSVSLLKWIGIVGVALGVFSLIVVIAIMRGFEKDFEGKILGFQAPVNLDLKGEATEAFPSLEKLRNEFPVITAGEQRIEGEVVIESAFTSSSAARVRGIDRLPSQTRGLGRLTLSSESETAEEASFFGSGSLLPGIILGSELAVELQVHPDFKDDVRVVFPFGDLSPSGEIMPRIRRFRVMGLFDSGFYEYDSKFAIIAAPQAERLFGDYGRKSLALFLKNNVVSAAFKMQLQQLVPKNWQVTTWRERNQRLFQALLLERVGMFLLLLMVILLASFTIFALISMIVLEKIQDMAVLRAMGMKRKQVRRVFLWQAGRLGLRGTIIGGVLGILVSLYLYYFPYELPPSYYMQHLPLSLEPALIMLILLAGPLISILAGLYPARQSTRPIVAEVLRYE